MVCFQTKNPNLGKIVDGLAMERVGLFYGHLVCLKLFGIFYGHLGIHFMVIWYVVSRKIWQPCLEIYLTSGLQDSTLKITSF
jgi:hypothetical protein